MFYKWFYQPITTILSPVGMFVLWIFQLLASKETKEIWRQRRGLYQGLSLPSRPRIWIHAASVGEMVVAEAIIPQLQKFRPDCEIILTAMTTSGYQYACRQIDISAIYIVPIDFPQMVNRAMHAISATVFVLLETEFWPNLVVSANRHKIPVCLINGRISQKTPKTIFAKNLYRPILSMISKFSMISDHNKNRILLLGADPRRIVVHPNAKFDVLPHRVAECKQVRFLKPLTSHVAGKHVFVAGSIRHGEFTSLIEAAVQISQNDSNSVFIFAPRHLKRVSELIDQLQTTGFQVELYSNVATTQKKVTAWVVDTMGDLFSIYQHATVAFCGSSFVPLGGQNIFEPAAWGKPVLSGPSLEDFELARNLLLKYEGLLLVNTATELAAVVLDLFQHPEKQHQMGQNAYRALTAALGGAQKHAKEILPYLSE